MEYFADILIAVAVILVSAFADGGVKWLKRRFGSSGPEPAFNPPATPAPQPRPQPQPRREAPADRRQGYASLIDSLPEEGQRITADPQPAQAEAAELLGAESDEAEAERLDRLRQHLIMGEILARKF